MNYSTVGRARKLSDAQIEEILTILQPRPSIQQVAARFGVGRQLISLLLKTHGKHYKRNSPK